MTPSEHSHLGEKLKERALIRASLATCERDKTFAGHWMPCKIGNGYEVRVPMALLINLAKERLALLEHDLTAGGIDWQKGDAEQAAQAREFFGQGQVRLADGYPT